MNIAKFGSGLLQPADGLTAFLYQRDGEIIACERHLHQHMHA